MNRVFLGALALIFFGGCAHYVPSQYIGGKKHKYGLYHESCSDYIFAFPANRQNMTVANAIENSGLKRDQIHSIEVNYWAYFFPVYWQMCTMVMANDTVTDFPYRSDALPNPTYPRRKYQPEVTQGEEDMVYFTHIRDIKECDQYGALSKGNCRKAVYERSKKR